METLATVLAVITLAVFIRATFDIEVGKLQISQLHTIARINPIDAPPVSVIIPACNEERQIEAALQSVLKQDYPDLEVIAVNDRSSDRTGDILDRIAASCPTLKVVHIANLPKDWLGKNNALHTGASKASGEWLLFADADVAMESSVIARAIGYVLARNVDHLAVTPRALVGGFLANVFLGGFAFMFSMHTRPWKVRDPKTKEYIGIGAFNLVRGRAYRSVGGHAPIAMRPDDDLKLGKLLKHRGFRSDFAIGTELLSVEWYRSFPEMRNGLMKNMFSVLDYSLTLALLACASQFLLFVWPFLAIAIMRGNVQWLNAGVAICALIACASNGTIVKVHWWWSLTLPLAAFLSMYLMMRAALLTLRNGGIEWRGTRYPLDQLRANRF
jgi:glycosyltransferase involved in cell wall biosynthesis